MSEAYAPDDQIIEPLTYAGAGVNIDEGARLVRLIKPLAKATSRAGAGISLGGYAAMLDLKAAGFVDPLVFTTTDGVGTKLKIAIEAEQHETIGIDLVAMCVNDLLCQGAEPLVFLDYYASGSLDADKGAKIIRGIADGCKLANCALAGGETAEMPGLYADKDYDLAGFALGAAERSNVLPHLTKMREGDLIVGLASSGPHSNGYSLIRKVVNELNLSWSDKAPFDSSKSVAEALLEPTRIYTNSILPLIRDNRLKALAHITGGGLVENVPRVLPRHLKANFHWTSWPQPNVFNWLQRAGVSTSEMRRTFNLGIGMVAVVEATEASHVVRYFQEQAQDAFVIGELIS